MGFYEKENNGFSELYRYVLSHRDKKYTFMYNNSKIIASFDCMYESDNGLEEDEDGYDEYHAIGFVNLETDELFEVNYSNMPLSVICESDKVI